MARAATRDPAGRPVGPRVRAGHPGHGRRRGLGQRRGPRRGHRRRSSSRPSSSRADGTERRLAAARARARLPGEPVQGRRRGAGRGPMARRAARRDRPRSDVRASSRPRRTSSASASTTSGTGARRNQPLGIPSAGSVFRNPADGPSRRRAHRSASGSRARRRAGRRSAPSTPTSSSTTGAGPPPTSAASPSGSGRRSPADRRRARLRGRVPRRLVGLAAPTRRRRESRTGRGPAADRRPPRRPIGRARRLDRLGQRHRRRPRGDRPSASGRVCIDLAGALVVAARRTIAATTVRPRPTTTRPPSAPTARSASARPSTGSPPRGPRRSSSSPSTVRSARTARSRRLLEAAGLAYTGSGVAASAIGMDKAALQATRPRPRAAGRRLARDPGRPLGGRPGRGARRARGVRRRHRRPAAHDQAGRPRLERRHVDRPRRGRARPGDRRAPSATTTVALAERYLPAPATSRSASSATTGGALELYGPGEIVAGHEFYDYAAKYTRRPVRDIDRGPSCRRPSGRRSSSSPATPTGRSGPRASPGSTSSSPARRSYLSEINTIPGFTPISLFPTLPAEGGPRLRGGLRADRRPRPRAPRRARSRRRLEPADLPR